MGLPTRPRPGGAQGRSSKVQYDRTVYVLALADDLTGALETGAKFAAAGVEAVVSAEPEGAPDAPVVVLDTETRHLAAGAAAERVERLVRAAREAGARFLYQKTDSTLRGNIGAELGAVARGWPGAALVYAPAYPRMGRTVRAGRLYVNGVPVSETAFARDPLNPVVESEIARVLGPEAAGAVRIWDGATDADVAEAARAAVEGGGAAAGPAALAEALAAILDLPRGAAPEWPPVRRALLVNGSLHPVAQRQQEHAEAHGWPAAGPEEAGTAPWTVLRVPDIAGESAPGRARRVGGMVAGVLARTGCEGLVVFGGDTAYGIVRALGCPVLWPLREIVPGVPLARATVRGRELYLVTKAGGFGPPAAATAIRAIMEKGS